jgi:hypothetical protein
MRQTAATRHRAGHLAIQRNELIEHATHGR